MQPETKKEYVPVEPREHSENCHGLFDTVCCQRCQELAFRAGWGSQLKCPGGVELTLAE